MAAKSSSNQTTKEDKDVLKNLLPVILFSTVVVVAVCLIGRKATEE